MAGRSKPRTLIPSAATLLPLPDSALRMVRLMHDWLAIDSALSGIILEACNVARRIRQARAEMTVAPDLQANPAMQAGSRWAGWPGGAFVSAGLTHLENTLQKLFDHLGWVGFLKPDQSADAAKWKPCINGKPVDIDLASTGWVRFNSTPPPVPTEMLAAVEHAAELLGRTLLPALGERRKPGNAPKTDMTLDGADAADAARLPRLLAAADLAAKLSMTRGVVNSFLTRFRQTHPDCCEPVESPRRNDPRILYRTADVVPALEHHRDKRK